MKITKEDNCPVRWGRRGAGGKWNWSAGDVHEGPGNGCGPSINGLVCAAVWGGEEWESEVDALPVITIKPIMLQ